MKKIITIFIMIFVASTLLSCDVSTTIGTSNTSNITNAEDGSNNSEKIPLPKSDDDYLWPNYEEVYNDFIEAGFTNVILEPIYDLTGDEWFTSDGDCEDILVDGKKSFKEGDLYSANVEIRISYHAIKGSVPENSDKITATMNSADFVGLTYEIAEKILKEMGFYKLEYESLETEKEGYKNGEVYEIKVKGWLFDSALENEKTYDKDTTIIIKYYIVKEKIPNLTIENCDELYELLMLKDPGHKNVADFAKKYKGRTIEFDGSIYDIANVANKKTRYNVLIGAGDFNPDSMSGPNFRLSDVSMLDMGLGVYDEINVGDNLHIIAEVGTYNSNTQFFELKIIGAELRD